MSLRKIYSQKKERLYPFNGRSGGPQHQSEYFRDEKDLAFMREIELRFVGRPAQSLYRASSRVIFLFYMGWRPKSL